MGRPVPVPAPARRSRARSEPSPSPPPAESAVDRFRQLDPYRADREWKRYEGTPQRELWRELRERFLRRHRTETPWALDLGSGPGRFTSQLGAPSTRRVALDVSREMLRALRFRWDPGAEKRATPDLVHADGRSPPFGPASFGEVAVLGNTLGFAGADGDRLREVASELVASHGTLVLEVAPGPGERSRYLTRLPASSLARLFRAPVPALLPRVEREGFDPLPFRRSEDGEFRRYSAAAIARALEPGGWEVTEVMAVAPALGALAARIGTVRSDPKAWEHLLALEEEIGRRPGRWPSAASVLLAAKNLGRL
jgi:SAM-dependent methyltransferase